ncbi:MAG: ComEA family DNA-binding protein [Thermodesulfobacteriota bacterium]|nr:ComEA family DNA-binding protein [Thermodesulfobacteriota bacterium]
MRKMKVMLVLSVVAAFIMVLSGPAIGGDVKKININKASIEELIQLKRIGPKYAKRIIEYREKNGPFKAPQDIMKVKGIGQRTFEVNKELITV